MHISSSLLMNKDFNGRVSKIAELKTNRYRGTNCFSGQTFIRRSSRLGHFKEERVRPLCHGPTRLPIRGKPSHTTIIIKG